jgi:hypothetical protein
MKPWPKYPDASPEWKARCGLMISRTGDIQKYQKDIGQMGDKAAPLPLAGKKLRREKICGTCK